MKLCAPRCSEGRSLTELPARHCCQFNGSGAAALSSAIAATGSHDAAHTPSTSSALLSMKRDSFGHRFDRIDARVDRHEQEKQEIGHCKYARQGHVDTLCGLQTQIHQPQEGDD